ncbi:MAG: hypothetical protein H6735_01330 [Alphaproteobacteria bacterium]|nr:hypothetical protein [Alphaproteobacteria bacterium]
MLLISMLACDPKPSLPEPTRPGGPTCEALELPTCGSNDKLRHADGCTGLLHAAYDSPICYADGDPAEVCGHAFGGPCGTFLDLVVQTGLLDAPIEDGRTPWPPGPDDDTGFQEQYLERYGLAQSCTTSDGAHYDFVLTSSSLVQYDPGSLWWDDHVWDRWVGVWFDATGKVRSVRRGSPVCCAGRITDWAWWGDPNDATAPACVGDHCCVEWHRYQQDELQRMVEQQRRSAIGHGRGLRAIP